MSRSLPFALLGALLFCLPSVALGQEPPSKPAPYSLPWQLRPTPPTTVIRSDTSVASFQRPDGSEAWTVASMLLGSYELTPNFLPMVRFGYAHTTGGNPAALNPVLGGTYTFLLGSDFKLALFLAVTVPVGSGGGDAPDPRSSTSLASGILTRSAMDNAMFAVNDFTVFPGIGLSWQRAGFTVQVESTVLQLTRVRGAAAQSDASRTNFTAGLHVGYFPIDALSVGAELRYQRWLSTPSSVTSPELRDNVTAAFGLRYHRKIGAVTLRPGISITAPLDAPMAQRDYLIGQLDIPVAF